MLPLSEPPPPLPPVPAPSRLSDDPRAQTALLVVWFSTKRSHISHTRPLTALTSPETHLPLAFTPEFLYRSSFFAARTPATAHSLHEMLIGSSATSPVLVPLLLAEMELGWTDVTFHEPEPEP